MWAIIGTWNMSFDGINKVCENGIDNAQKALVNAICDVEDNPYFISVGYGGLPNKQGRIQLDAAYMDGATLQIGAIAGVSDIKNPIKVAYELSKRKVNNFLVGEGAYEYALLNGFETKNMLTSYSLEKYEVRKNEYKEQLNAYDGHDTVGMIALDSKKNLAVATSTSGLFMKENGRIGDSALPGSGFYVKNNVGGASATGLGEDIMKGCVAYEIVRLMEQGINPQVACEKVVTDLVAQLEKNQEQVGDISVIALNDKGEWGVATNIEQFSFVVATKTLKPCIYIAQYHDKKTIISKASPEWIANTYNKYI